MSSQTLSNSAHPQLFVWVLRIGFAIAAFIMFRSAIKRWRAEPTTPNLLRIGLLILAWGLIAFAILLRIYAATD